MSDGFDKSEFDDDLDAIEDYLGYLKGNDLMHQYWRDWEIAQSKVDLPPWPVAFEYTSPCPDGRYQVEFSHYPLIELTLAEGENTSQLDVQLQQLKDDLDQSWHNGQAWAGGVAGQMRQICAQFTEPYVPTMAGAVELLQSQVVSKLDLGANADWLNLGDAQVEWDGDFAQNFRVFYNNYSSVIDNFGKLCAQVTLGFSLGARIIAAAQLGAGKFTRSLKKNLESQLDHWADSGGEKPNDPPEWPAWIGNVGDVINSTLDLTSAIPVVGDVVKIKDYYTKINTVMEDVDTLVGGGLLGEEKTYQDVMDGSQAYDLLSETLYGFYQDYRDGMDSLNSGGAGSGYEEESFSSKGLLANLKDVKDRDDFELPDVPAANLN